MNLAFKNLNFLFFLLSIIHSLTPQLYELQARLMRLESEAHILSQQRNNIYHMATTVDQQRVYHYNNSLMKSTQKCKFQGKQLSTFIFQTTTNVFMIVCNPQQNESIIYDTKCQEISLWKNIIVDTILCDRGICQSGLVYFIGKDQHLYHSIQDKEFSKPIEIANLKENHKIIGGVLRFRGKDKIQIYIAYQNGVVKVFDEEGTQKLRFQIQGFESQLSLIVDHHPYPLIIAKSNWITMLETTKYNQVNQNCPHIPNIKYVLSENFYGQTFFIITNNKILVIGYQIGKRICNIKREYNLDEQISHINKAVYYSNCIFMDDKVYNMTERRMYYIDCQQTSNEFLLKKNHMEEVFLIKKCCQQDDCTVSLIQMKKVSEEKSVFFWLTISFIIVIFLSLSFMKKSQMSNLQQLDNDQGNQNQVVKQIGQIAKLHKQKNKSKKK